MSRRSKQKATPVMASAMHSGAPVSEAGWHDYWRVAAVCVLLAAVTWWVFGQTTGFSFVNFDDGVYVYGNPKVQGGLSLKNLAWVFTHMDCSIYHPLTMLSLMGDYQLHGLHAGGYHLTNVLLHIASVILLFLILRQMTGALWRSAFVAAVFAIHPLRVESVAWVAERKDVLGAFFFMLTLGAYVHYVRKPVSLGRYLMVAVAFVLALLSKPTVVTLPFVLLLLDYWPLNRFEQAGPVRQAEYFGIPRRLILEKIPLLALTVGACVITVLAEGREIASRAHVSMLSRIGTALVAYAVYLRQMVWPAGLAPYYPDPEKGYAVWTLVLSFLLLALITGGVVTFGRKRRWLLTGWLWYLVMMGPMIGLVQVGSFAYADRMTYLPQIGLYLLVAWTVADLSTHWRHRRATLGGLAAIILVALIFCAQRQTAYWRDNETLWNHTLDCMPDNFMAHNNLGNALLQNGNVNEAIAHYQKAVESNPNYAQATYNLGNALLQSGNVDEAIVYYKKALQIKSDNPETHANLGSALLQKGQLDEAIFHYEKALQSNPNYEQAHINLAGMLIQKGKFDEAIAHYQMALEINPDNAVTQDDLGHVLLQKGKVDEAIAHYQKALAIKPDSVEVQNILAWELATAPQASSRNGNEAVKLAQQANQLTGGRNPAILCTLAAAYAEAGRFDDAVRSAQKAMELEQGQGQSGLVEQINGELKLYEAGLPFHPDGK